MDWKDLEPIFPPSAIVRAPTIEDAYEISRLIEEIGFVTNGAEWDYIEKWHEYKERTCYNLRFKSRRVSYAGVRYYETEYEDSNRPPEEWFLCSVEDVARLIRPEEDFCSATNEDLIGLLFE